MSKIFEYIKEIGPIKFLLLFLFFLDPFLVGFLFGYAIVIILFLDIKFLKSSFDLDAVLLFTFSIIYAVFYSFDITRGVQVLFMYLFFPLVFYLIGKLLVTKAENENTVLVCLIGLGVVFSLPALISVLNNIYIGGFVQSSRDVQMIWGGAPVAATGLAAYLCLNMCIPAILFSRIKFNLTFKLFLIIVYVLSMVCVLRLGSRTQIGISLITLIVSIIYNFPRQTIKQNLTVFGILALIIIYLGQSAAFSGKSDVFASYADRMESKKYGAATAGGRTERWEKSLVNLFEKPLGWDLDEFGYSHNLWLDILRVGGVLSFFILLLFSIRGGIFTVKALKKNKERVSLNTAILVYSLAIFLQLLVEPIYEGLFHLMIIYCLIQGMVKVYYIESLEEDN